MSRRAYSLTETILAIFVLVFGMLIVVQLFHSGLRHSTSVEKKLMASVLAEKRMAELRGWARNPASFAAVAGFPTGPDADYPAMQVNVQVVPVTVFSPCTTLESPYAPPRTMTRSFLKARVAVSWPPYGPSDQVAVLSLLGDAARPLASLSVTAPGVVPPLGTVTVTAAGIDTGGQAVPDLFVRWYINSLSGSGTVVPDSTGSSADFSNVVTRFDGTQTTTGGVVQVQAFGRSAGVEVMSPPAVINL